MDKEIRKIGGVVISHGQVATELVAAAEAVVGDVGHLAAVSIGWHDDVEMAKDEISRAIANVSAGNGVILLTDMFGGTPTNIAAMFLKENEVEIVTGMNLPMVIKLASGSSRSTLREIAHEIEEQGKDAIRQAGLLLSPQKIK